MIEESPGECLAILAAIADENSGHIDPPNGASVSVRGQDWPQMKRFANCQSDPLLAGLVSCSGGSHLPTMRAQINHRRISMSPNTGHCRTAASGRSPALT